MILSEKIQELSEVWGQCCTGHHKSKDHVHIIEEYYQYGKLDFNVLHYAYIGNDINQSFNTKRAAQEYLCRELISQIEKQIKNNIEICENPNWGETDQPLDYWLSLQKTFELVRNYECSDSPAQTNWEELYLDIKQKYESQKHDLDLVNKILDENNIPKFDSDYPELEFSVNYRLELLLMKNNK